jgi:GGDEF domain-containing protein
MLETELKRAVRTQSFVALLVVEAKREWDAFSVAVDAGTLNQLGELVALELRDTDLVSATGDGRLSVVLPDADIEHAKRIVDRGIARIDAYDFAIPLSVAVGAACYPTDAVDARSLAREALSRPLVSRRKRPARAGTADY